MLIFKILKGILFLTIGLVFLSCEPPIESGIYKEKLVVFGNLKANQPVKEPIYVSLSSSIDEAHEFETKWVNDAVVTISDGDTTIRLTAPHAGGIKGGYIDLFGGYLIKPNTAYSLKVVWKDDQVTAETIVPDTLHLSSISSSDWDCEGKSVFVDTINLHLNENPDWMILEAIQEKDYSQLKMDSVSYKTGECYTTSFASVPMFVVQWEAESDPGLIRVVSHALENDPENAIVDTSLSAHIFKGHMFINEDGEYYWPSPIVWHLSQPILDFGWLSFNFYGVHLIEIQVADQAFQDYFRGFPMGPPQNQFILPESNVEGGYGLFSSTYSAQFLVYVKR